MNRVWNLTIMLAITLFMHSFSNAQVSCSPVTVSSFPKSPQSGPYDYYGVRVTLAHVYNQNVSVSGTITEQGGQNVTSMFTLTVTAGNLTAETSETFYAATQGIGVVIDVESISPCPPTQISASYAGVTITYEVENNILRFASISEAYAVLEQLEVDYDNYNDNYDSQYPNLTEEQLDDMDEQNGFDEFLTYRNFEGLFSGFSSKRSEIESIENTWLSNNFSGTDPDDVDLTYDDAVNTIFNNNYSFKIGNDLYQLSSSGMYINGVLQDDEGGNGFKPGKIEITNEEYAVGIDLLSVSGPMYSEYNSEYLLSVCKTNKKKPYTYEPSGTNRQYRFKVAISYFGVGSSVNSKVVHYKAENGNWDRKRAKLAVAISATVRGAACNYTDNPNKTDPSTWGTYKKRKSLQVSKMACCTIWRAYSGNVVGTLATPEGYGGTLSVTW